jgi:hypothetical protein
LQFRGLFTTVIALSTLGTSVTFSYVLTNSPASQPDPRYSVFSAYHVQSFLAISWLLFLLCLAAASLFQTLLTLFKEHWIKDWDGLTGITSHFEVHMYAVFAVGLTSALIIAALVLLCLVVVANAPVVGWVALGFTGFLALIIVVGVLHQAPWPWRGNMPRAGSYEGGACAKTNDRGTSEQQGA